MNEHLDTVVAQGIYKAHLLERALHCEGPWYLRWSGKLRVAERVKDANGVTFTATFDVPDEPESLVTLVHRGHDQAVRVMPSLLEIDGDKPVQLAWRIGLRVEDLSEVE